MNRLLITGASGFLGQAFLKKILANSNFRTSIIARSSSSLVEISKIEGFERLEHLIVINSIDDLYRELQNVEIDIVLHLATSYGQSNEKIEQIVDANLILPLTLLKIASGKEISHFVNIDSFYNKPGNVQNKLFDYSTSKAALKPWLEKYSTEMRISNLILEHMYGPKDKPYKFIPKLIASAKSDYQDGLRLSPGEQQRDFIYVEDVVDAIELVIENVTEGKIGYSDLPVGTGKTHDLISLSEIINEILDVQTGAPFSMTPYPDNEIMCSFAETEELNSLGWRPKYTLRQGLIKTISESEEA